MKTQPFPGEITLIVAQERVKKHLGARANVFIDGKFSFALSLEVINKHGLRPQMRLDAAQLAALLREDGEAKALVTAANFIGYRPRSKDEIRKRLQRDEWSEEVIARVVERLEGAKMLDDAQFAAGWVGARERSRPRGSRLLQQELRHKGVAREEIEAALPDAEAELQNALAALGKLERKLAPFSGRDRDQKAIEHLMRRGF
ncbi:MAG: RecX family transcriptional regulator, partial [Armatimonadetes bacterium]|nr:RecX family transcriptional regulator [Armatimonadota bacterium]